MLDATTMWVLALGHLGAFIMASWAAFNESRTHKRSVVLTGYLYVAFISMLTVATYCPVPLHLSLPLSLMDTLTTIRYVAILFFLLGILELTKKKGVNWV